MLPIISYYIILTATDKNLYLIVMQFTKIMSSEK